MDAAKRRWMCEERGRVREAHRGGVATCQKIQTTFRSKTEHDPYRAVLCRILTDVLFAFSPSICDSDAAHGISGLTALQHRAFCFFYSSLFLFCFLPLLVLGHTHTAHTALCWRFTGDCQQHCQEMINGFLWPVVILVPSQPVDGLLTTTILSPSSRFGCDSQDEHACAIACSSTRATRCLHSSVRQPGAFTAVERPQLQW